VPEIIASPTLIPVPGGKTIEEYVGRASSSDEAVSIAHMVAPAGWDEPFQAPEFDEFTVVLDGELLVDHGDETTSVSAGQAVITRAGERIRYRTEKGARYVAVCLPAFSIDRVNRED
jgi:mannose-6-phosphate isomerase-like protein (cupin superfamily)